jgi:hypothetical protein
METASRGRFFASLLPYMLPTDSSVFCHVDPGLARIGCSARCLSQHTRLALFFCNVLSLSLVCIRTIIVCVCTMCLHSYCYFVCVLWCRCRGIAVRARLRQAARRRAGRPASATIPRRRHAYERAGSTLAEWVIRPDGGDPLYAEWGARFGSMGGSPGRQLGEGLSEAAGRRIFSAPDPGGELLSRLKTSHVSLTKAESSALVQARTGRIGLS